MLAPNDSLGLEAEAADTSVAVNCSPSESSQQVGRVGRDVMFSGLSVIIPSGLVLNTLSLVVFISRAMRRRASSWYLAALAVSDSLSLISVSFDYWLIDDRIGLQVMRQSAVACVTVSHLSYASRLLSAWLVTTFTVERFIGVFYPLRRSLIISVSHARRVILAEIVACLALAGFVPFTIGIVDRGRRPGSQLPDCDVLPEMVHIYFNFNVAFVIIGSIVAPVLIIVTLNTAIFRRVRNRATMRNESEGNNSSEERQSPMNGAGLMHHQTFCLYHHHHHHHHQQQMHLQEHHGRQQTGVTRHRDYNVTVLLLVVSTTFVVLNVPYCISWFALYFYSVDRDRATSSCAALSLEGILHAAKYVATVPYCLNYGVNFALYSVCARAFRDQLVRVMSMTPFCGRFCRRQTPSHNQFGNAANLRPVANTPRAPRLRHVVGQLELLEVHRQLANEQQVHCQCHLPDLS